jgi:flagellar assembly protein FliH
MAKAVFRTGEIVAITDKIVIGAPTTYPEIKHLAPIAEKVEVVSSIEEYKGPTADDIRREAEMFKAHWEEEKEKMLSGAKIEAEDIIKNAQEAAFAEVKRKTDEGQVIRQQAEQDAGRIISDAQNRAYQIENELRQNISSQQREALDKGREEGLSEGFDEGKAEVDRLIERTRLILERAQDKRAEILAETEQEIVNLVLLIARKVIKVISENQRNIIISNVIEALRKVKARGNVIIRVNMLDLKLTTEHKEDFISMLEGVKSIQVVEDSSVDSGGCIIETDFGEIDARIASQLAELENRILEISPVKTESGNYLQPLNLATEKAASSLFINSLVPEAAVSKEDEMSPAANAALTASAALAALAALTAKKAKSDGGLTA